MTEKLPGCQERRQRVIKGQRPGGIVFTQFFSASVPHQRNVTIHGVRKTKLLLQVELPGCGFEQIRSAHDMGNVFYRVIHYNRQLVGGKPIGSADNEIADLLSDILLDWPCESIDKSNRFVFNPKAD